MEDTTPCESVKRGGFKLRLVGGKIVYVTGAKHSGEALDAALGRFFPDYKGWPNHMLSREEWVDEVPVPKLVNPQEGFIDMDCEVIHL